MSWYAWQVNQKVNNKEALIADLAFKSHLKIFNSKSNLELWITLENARCTFKIAKYWNCHVFSAGSGFKFSFIYFVFEFWFCFSFWHTLDASCFSIRCWKNFWEILPVLTNPYNKLFSAAHWKKFWWQCIITLPSVKQEQKCV